MCVNERENASSFLTTEFPLFAARRFAAVRWIASFRSCCPTFGFALPFHVVAIEGEDRRHSANHRILQAPFRSLRRSNGPHDPHALRSALRDRQLRVTCLVSSNKQTIEADTAFESVLSTPKNNHDLLPRSLKNSPQSHPDSDKTHRFRSLLDSISLLRPIKPRISSLPSLQKQASTDSTPIRTMETAGFPALLCFETATNAARNV